MASGFRGISYALGTGWIIATYTVLDGMGARAAQVALVYTVLLTLGDGIAMVGIVVMRRGLASLRTDVHTWKLCTLAAAMQVSASWMATWALSQASMGLMPALRESSVMFAGLLAAWLMKERLRAIQVFACFGELCWSAGAAEIALSYLTTDVRLSLT